MASTGWRGAWRAVEGAVFAVVVVVGALALSACPRTVAPAAPPPAPEASGPPAASPPPPPPPPPPPMNAGLVAAPVADAPAGAGHHRAGAAGEEAGASHGAIGKVTVRGSVGRGEIERVLRGSLAKLKACQAGAAAGKGQVELALTIGERGWATLVEVKRSTLGGGDPQMCIVNTLRALRFPKPPDAQDTAVSFTLQFR